MIHPAIHEALILGLIGVSGVSTGVLFGVRQAIPLAATALGVGVSLRDLSAFAAWSTSTANLAFDYWLWSSAVVSMVGAIVIREYWREFFSGLTLFGAAAVAALATKYVFDIGERHHSDSAHTVALALIAIQSETTDLSVIANSPKRGIAYPLLLALGPSGRILGGLTPLIMILTVLLAGWLAWSLAGSERSPRVFTISVVALGAFSLSVPMFRASFFYLNGHTLMALGLLLMVVAWMTLRQAGEFSAASALILGTGGVVGVTARAEGIVLVSILVAFVVSEGQWGGVAARARLGGALAVIGASVTWWFGSLSSPVLDRFGVSVWWLMGLTLVGAALASVSWIDPLRRWITPIAGVVLIALLLREVFSSGKPIGMALAQWPNLGLGAGGWATAAHMFIGSMVLIGLTKRSIHFRQLLFASALVIGGILFTKTFDGGFGGAGFYDSVNRMWLHVMPLVMTASLLGYSELLGDIIRQAQQPRYARRRETDLVISGQ